MRECGGRVRVWPTPALHGAPNGAGQCSLMSGILLFVGLTSALAEANFEHRSPTTQTSELRTRKREHARSSKKRSATQTEFLKQGPVAVEVLVLEIVEKATSLAHDLEQTAARVMVLRVRFEMFLKAGDALGEQRDLNFGRTRVGLTSLSGLDDVRLDGCRDQFVWLLILPTLCSRRLAVIPSSGNTLFSSCFSDRGSLTEGLSPCNAHPQGFCIYSGPDSNRAATSAPEAARAGARSGDLPGVPRRP
jgi:hypothetical protein